LKVDALARLRLFVILRSECSPSPGDPRSVLCPTVHVIPSGAQRRGRNLLVPQDQPPGGDRDLADLRIGGERFLTGDPAGIERPRCDAAHSLRSGMTIIV
jgi:hypothetical protein